VTVQELKPDEIEAHVLPLARFIASTTPYPVPTDPEGCVRRWKQYSELGIARTWALPGVAIGCTVTEHFFTGLPSAVVVFWWADESARKRGLALSVFKHAEQQLRESGVRLLYSSAHADHQHNRISEFHQRNGFERCETAFRKVL
jgi:GNAT superfamily N-acetyltransferase